MDAKKRSKENPLDCRARKKIKGSGTRPLKPLERNSSIPAGGFPGAQAACGPVNDAITKPSCQKTTHPHQETEKNWPDPLIFVGVAGRRPTKDDNSHRDMTPPSHGSENGASPEISHESVPLETQEDERMEISHEPVPLETQEDEVNTAVVTGDSHIEQSLGSAYVNGRRHSSVESYERK